MPSSTPKPRSVLVTGANGYIGLAVASAFARAGWQTYGLVRRASSTPTLHAAEVIPIIGSSAAPEEVLAALEQHTPTIDVIVSTTEANPGYRAHFEDNIRLFRSLAEKSNKHNVRPLLIFTSGCKDYGRTGVHGSEGLAPHTEESKLDPPVFATERAKASEEVLVTNLDLMDSVTTRPTLLWGHAASFSGPMFEMVEKAAAAEREGKGTGLYVGVDKNTIYHACHVDDVGEAYVAIAEGDRSLVKGKVYNISGQRYVTMEDVVKALVKEYGVRGPVTWEINPNWELAYLLDYSQWVGSPRIRKDLGWKDRRLNFVDNVGVYRRAYELAREGGDERVQMMAKKTGHDYGKKK